MDEVDAAVNGLEQLGLTEYEASCFVALTRIPHGTAKEIAQVADIPRSRVYETMERLHKRGLVEVQEAEPKTFQSVPIDTALRQLRKEYESYFETVEQKLRELEPVYKDQQQAVWRISNHEAVTERILQLIDDATNEVVVTVLDEILLGDDVLSTLAAADERGVAVHIPTPVATIHERIESAAIEANVFSTDLIEWFGSMTSIPRLGRAVMVDRGPVLMSILHEERLPGVPMETAVWCDGIDHGFATFVQRVMTYEFNEQTAASNPDE